MLLGVYLCKDKLAGLEVLLYCVIVLFVVVFSLWANTV